jgi:hypothetical protein
MREEKKSRSDPKCSRKEYDYIIMPKAHEKGVETQTAVIDWEAG